MKRTKRQIMGSIVEPVLSSKIIDNNTIRIQYQDRESIRLHDTDIITFWPNGITELNSGGWHTRTTKERIYRYAKIWINQVKGIWSVGGSLFYDCMKFNSDKELISEVKPIDLKVNDAMKKRIAKYVSLVSKDNLPLPNSGDCWYCSMRTEDGQIMGGTIRTIY